MTRLVEVIGNIDHPTHSQKDFMESDLLDMAVLDVQFMKLPGWSSAAFYYFITSYTAEYPMWGGSRWSIWVSRAGVTKIALGRLGERLARSGMLGSK
eukprot:1089385-Pelagomonas_calceolata.AAC.1